MLTTVAVLIVVLGLMVSLAREVRFRSAELLTKELLWRLDGLMHDYVARTGHVPGQIPEILLPTDVNPDEAIVRRQARINNLALVEALRGDIARSNVRDQDRQRLRGRRDVTSRPTTTTGSQAEQSADFNDLPIYGQILADAWGNPIVFMPRQHPAIGMAPQKGPEESAFLLLQAGPDGRYLTRADNLYSYEQAKE